MTQPLAEAPAQTGAAPHSAEPVPSGDAAPVRGEPVVLVIDDEENCRQLYVRILDTIGCKTHTAHDGPSGLKLWRYLHPDLVVLDLMMPGPNGLQMLEQARREGLGAEVIITTALMKKPLIERAASLHVFSYLAKPFMVDKFIATVKAAIPAFSVGGNQPKPSADPETPASLISPVADAHASPSSPLSPSPSVPNLVSGGDDAPAAKAEPDAASSRDASAPSVPGRAAQKDATHATPTRPLGAGTGNSDGRPADSRRTNGLYTPPTLEALQEAHPAPQDLLHAIRDVLRECARHNARLPQAWIAYLTSGTSTQIAHLLEDTLADAPPKLRAVLADCVSPNLLRYSVHFVASLLQDTDADVACRALCAARGIDDARIRDLVFAALMHREPSVRLQARDILESGAYPAALRLLVRVLTGEACEETISVNALRFLQKLAKDPGTFDEALESFPTQPQNVRKYIRQLVAHLVQDEDDTELVMTLLDERHLQTQKLGVEKVRKDVRKHMARKDAPSP